MKAFVTSQRAPASRAIVRALAVACVALGLVGACKSESADGGETHWLAACDSNADCGTGYCFCGTCTHGCGDDSACSVAGGPSAECVATASPGLAGRCATGAKDEKAVCLATCKDDAGCAKAFECLGGACVPVLKEGAPDAAPAGASGGRSSVSDASAGGGGAGGAGGRTADGGTKLGAGGGISDASISRPSPTEFADVHVPQNFNDPISLPLPATKIVGDASAFVGSWVERGFSGHRCTPANPASDLGGSVCSHIDIRPDGHRGFVAVTYRESSINNGAFFTGPAAPPTDPNVGYPTNVRPENYYGLQVIMPGVKYQLLDARVTGDTLTFWFSPMDLWSGWCAMQTPFEWNIGARRAYRCVPQGADASSTDLGKLALCTSDQDGPVCTDPGGYQTPCACLTSPALCGPNYCECSATECHASIRNAASTGSFTLRSTTLVGAMQLNASDVYPMTLEREAQ